MTNNGYWIAFLSETRDLPGKCLLVLSLDDGAISHKNRRYRKNVISFKSPYFYFDSDILDSYSKGKARILKKLEVKW